MNGGRALSFVVLMGVFLAGCASHPEGVAFRVGDARMTAPVKSVLELRNAKLIRQGWDISCGAAALSTILTYQFEEAYSEATIVVSILKNTDPQLVRERGGFSLLDLKRFTEAVGYRASGYGELSIEDLEAFDVPAILPVRIRNYDHFVVFRGRAGNRVLVGDPAFGNLTIPIEEFFEMWPSRIGFMVFQDDELAFKGNALAPNTMNLMVPNLNHVYRMLNAGGVLPATRRAGAGYP